MAKKKIDGAATAASEPEVSGAVSLGTALTAASMDTATAARQELKDNMANTLNLPCVTTILAERDLNILIEAQKIRRDPARFMAAKALPQAQKHYIV